MYFQATPGALCFLLWRDWKVTRRRPNYQEENRRAAQIWFIFGNNVHMMMFNMMGMSNVQTAQEGDGFRVPEVNESWSKICKSTPEQKPGNNGRCWLKTQCPQWNVFYTSMGWDATQQGRSSYSKRNVKKSDCSLQKDTGTKIFIFGCMMRLKWNQRGSLVREAIPSSLWRITLWGCFIK